MTVVESYDILTVREPLDSVRERQIRVVPEEDHYECVDEVSILFKGHCDFYVYYDIIFNTMFQLHLTRSTDDRL